MKNGERQQIALSILNTIPYALLYGKYTQYTSQHSRFHWQVLGFMVCSTTWFITNHKLSKPIATPLLETSIPDYIINSEYYTLMQRTISGSLTGCAYALGRRNNIIVFGLFGGLLGSLTYPISHYSLYSIASTPLTSFYEHLMWLNPFEKVDRHELIDQYTTELQHARSTKLKLETIINDLTRQING